ncbi:fused isobutyryl-CoA mutase/GTPase IcmF [Peredibacter starrii]|uniref:Fused isobutyryl-CoA mutase/GTPase IcmF n=1 Tax=Peredibacter starrii TaxID=28202 RepID=A0AAX4HPX6_9BACT|nr:fused isobutyryl-CoA mutase/GTPase IcmF [Peredibacter starrii]WPU65314.1 fused isobutyryl-CoA mutase/GTPase IcmF [Peredibacter starrii]
MNSRKLRFVTAGSLFDGHDASINIMRRLLQSKGVEVIHLGHNRSALEVVEAALSEDAHAVALSSYQGGHMEYFTYVRELLDQNGGKNVRIFGGGGGVITPPEIQELHKRGITRLYHPNDGTSLGLNGIIDDMIAKCDYSTLDGIDFKSLSGKKLTPYQMAKVITFIEDNRDVPFDFKPKNVPVFGITGTGGAGKSSLIDELLLRFHRYYSNKRVALVSVDPTKKKNQGALLGDRIRLGAAVYESFYVRSLATRDSSNELSPEIRKVVDFLKSQDFDLVLVETSGIGQASDEITKVADKTLYVMTPEYGASTQLEKIEMLEVADFIAVNKFEKPRSEDALRDVRKQYRRNKQLFAGHPGAPTDDELPIFGTMASKFNDVGVNALFKEIIKAVSFEYNKELDIIPADRASTKKQSIIPAGSINYLRDIASTVNSYNERAAQSVEKLRKYEALAEASKLVSDSKELVTKKAELETELKAELEEIAAFDNVIDMYKKGEYTYVVRGKDIKVPTKYVSLSQQAISKVGFPRLHHPSAKLQFIRSQNLPGFYPFAAGVFPFKRADEDPKRQFAGEGGPKRTNARFHYLSKNDNAKRLSTAFDSVTLYGEDPHKRPDIYGKVGESGVSICRLDDMMELYKGFDLTSPSTSVSMTINGPAPIILAMFMNTAINRALPEADQETLEKTVEIMRQVRGTVQADILKEDQAQNTCIFSLEFALKMMGDVQEFFCKHKIKNYYTVSISGYHIAEAGANPITQLALTLSNGFTYVEYYLSRGMKIDDFCENLSFFFSNGLDPEYTVLGRVARKIWAVTMKEKYGASEKSQKLKYHIQTSGRSLHAQEIDFNDIRTTLQAFLALSDNCNSLHTNAYDEAITTPTEESVRRAMAIQLIINREYGLNKTDNPLQGSYIVDELSDIVEAAVLAEFERISDKGGVLGAMESMYQRGKIQEESLYYETLKDSGEFPIIGVNTYLPEKQEEWKPIELSRASEAEKNDQIDRLHAFQNRNKARSAECLKKLRDSALTGGNIFEQLLTAVRYCSLGEITSVLYEVGGRYRRNM